MALHSLHRVENYCSEAGTRFSPELPRESTNVMPSMLSMPHSLYQTRGVKYTPFSALDVLTLSFCCMIYHIHLLRHSFFSIDPEVIIVDTF
jgi:hypothetical protein